MYVSVKDQIVIGFQMVLWYTKLKYHQIFTSKGKYYIKYCIHVNVDD